MKLYTQIPIAKADRQIDYQSRLLLLGSCFSENIGAKFEYFKFQSLSNPFGILFHPLAIEKVLERSVLQKKFTEDDIFYLNERWHCFDVHSHFSDVSKEALLDNLNRSLEATLDHLKKCTHVLITLGTAWVYRFKKSGETVANCHKVPQSNFGKELLGIDEIKSSLEGMKSLIGSINSNAEIIFTVSPVRHLKDGFIENQRSKAYLIGAIHDVVKKGHISYFPSYEIMMDELRDYRFYASDLVHPNQTAIEYIWDKFKDSQISQDVFKTMDEVDAIQKGLAHRSFNPASYANRKFQESLQDKIAYIKKDYPFMEF
jgi:hypothetical protein